MQTGEIKLKTNDKKFKITIKKLKMTNNWELILKNSQ